MYHPLNKINLHVSQFGLLTHKLNYAVTKYKCENSSNHKEMNDLATLMSESIFHIEDGISKIEDKHEGYLSTVLARHKENLEKLSELKCETCADEIHSEKDDCYIVSQILKKINADEHHSKIKKFIKGDSQKNVLNADDIERASQLSKLSKKIKELEKR